MSCWQGRLSDSEGAHGGDAIGVGNQARMLYTKVPHELHWSPWRPTTFIAPVAYVVPVAYIVPVAYVAPVTLQLDSARHT